MLIALVRCILEQLTAIAVEYAWRQLKLVTEVKKEVEKLERNFKAILYWLEDAEQRQIVDHNVQARLVELKRVSDDIKKVLDEWSTALSQSQTDPELDVSASMPKRMRTSITSWVSSCCQVVMHYDIANKIKRINERLDEIVKENGRYDLTEQYGRVESTSFIDVSKLHGRDEFKREIVKKLLNGTSEEGCIQTISIVGIGGIGKTALAQLIFNDQEVGAHFNNNVIWVWVSDRFDPNKIARAILGSLDKGSATNLQNPIPLQDVLTKISEKIRSAKFLLVLDDVWTHRDEVWEPLEAVFKQGMRGSRILVTTRTESVATGMGSSQLFHLEELSDEVCWLILSQSAFRGNRNLEDIGGEIAHIGREIATKCKGLPRTAKTLGRRLRGKNTSDKWQIVLDSLRYGN